MKQPTQEKGFRYASHASCKNMYRPAGTIQKSSRLLEFAVIQNRDLRANSFADAYLCKKEGGQSFEIILGRTLLEKSG